MGGIKINVSMITNHASTGKGESLMIRAMS